MQEILLLWANTVAGDEVVILVEEDASYLEDTDMVVEADFLFF
jgi:hypothetical protein